MLPIEQIVQEKKIFVTFFFLSVKYSNSVKIVIELKNRKVEYSYIVLVSFLKGLRILEKVGLTGAMLINLQGKF